MRREIETEPYYPLEELPAYEKIRRHRNPEYEENGRKKPKFQPANFSVVAPDQIILETPNIESLKQEFKPFHPLISRFVFKNGPEAVTKKVLRELGPNAVSLDFESNLHIEAMRTASGMTFERLACLYLNDIIEEKSKGMKRVLDHGSTNRIFQSLRDFDGSINFVPDGIVITIFRHEVTLFGLCEYKMSPHKNIEKFIKRIQIMTDFISRFSGQNLRINTRLDNYLGKKYTEIKVDNKPNINIVIPDNSSPNTQNISQDPRVNVHVAPFPRELPIRLAIASLKDFGKVISQT